jgi:hypothetical protein
MGLERTNGRTSIAAGEMQPQSDVRHLIAVAGVRPLTIHFSLYNPPESEHVAHVPRLLVPLGVFIRLRIEDASGAIVYENPITKATFTYDPADASSYQELQPGYSYGTVIVPEDVDLAPGRYTLHLEYANRQYAGSLATPVGELAATAALPFQVNDD